MSSAILKLLKVNFDLYHVTSNLSHICYSDIVPQDNLWDALIKFMEVSSVGDFELRLKMIKCFHVEMGTVESIVIAM